MQTENNNIFQIQIKEAAIQLTKIDEKLADSKLLILYILQKINKPVSYKELLELVISTADMNYFDFQQFLIDLLEDKFILKYVQDDKEIIELTADGKNALDLTIDMLPGILKLNVDKKFKENFNKIKDELSVFAEYTPITENDFSVKCKIVENNATIFNLEVNAGSKENAKNIVNNWNKNANQIYPEILEILSRNSRRRAKIKNIDCLCSLFIIYCTLLPSRII